MKHEGVETKTDRKEDKERERERERARNVNTLLNIVHFSNNLKL